MHLVTLCYPRGNTAAPEPNSKVEKDLKTWGILDTHGKVSPAGVASIIMLIEAKSREDVVKSLGSNSAIGAFYHEVILASDAQAENDDIDRFRLLLRDLLQKAETPSSQPKMRRAAFQLAEARVEPVSTQSHEGRGGTALEVLAKAVHTLAESSMGSPELALNRGGLRLRRKVLLMPKESPQQARIVWAIEGNLLPSGEALQDPDAYFAYVRRREKDTEAPWTEKPEKIDAIFAIYLGTKTCRVSLFSADNQDNRSQVLGLYAELLQQALRLNEPRTWVHAHTHSLVAPSATNPGRRTLTASWIREIDPSVTAAEILSFTDEVWAELSAAMLRIVNPTPEFVDRVRASLHGKGLK